MASHVFITGTDTGVGKTIVGGFLGAHWWVQGTRVRVLKPCETGCPTADQPNPDRNIERGALIPMDALHLAQMCGDPRPVEELCPYRFAEPLAPAVAAGRAKLRGRTSGAALEAPTLEGISASLMAAAADADRVLVEGAGGVLVPFSDSLMAIDIAAAHRIPTIIVARLGLGTINHTLLTLGELQRRDIPLVGVVLSATVPSDTVASRTNRQALAAHLGEYLLGVVPHLDGGGRELGRQDAATLAEQHLDLDFLEKTLSRYA